MAPCVIGIDTGGTCTDAVCVDSQNGRVIASTKVPTTHHHLADGIRHALTVLLQQPGMTGQPVATIALSTTLATNSVVENNGARVALFVIGHVKQFTVPVAALIYLKGGHKIDGEEEEPLELEALVNSLTHLKNEVDAYGVCSALSMINPTHELVAEKAISLIDPKPVFCSHRVSGRTGMKERAATAALHATLMPVMDTFITSVRAALEDLHLTCPLVIVAGNGSAIEPDQAVNHSGITVASGPACTALFGARHHNQTCLVIDVGGTTTDIALIRDGKPVPATDGCTIASWATHIESVDMHTGGIGGDSLVAVTTQRALNIGPARAKPLCFAPELPMDQANWEGFGTDGRLVALAVNTDSHVDDPLLAVLRERGCCTTATLARALDRSNVILEKRLEQLTRRRVIEIYGFTPTDALHVLGRADFGNRIHATRGAELLASAGVADTASLCRQAIAHTERTIAAQIVHYLAKRTGGASLAAILTDQDNDSLLAITCRVTVPLVGIGAAARFFLPGVAALLHTTVTFPTHGAVGNAVGAAYSVLQQQSVKQEMP